jgi:uncharacterized DUF497 family protein
MDILYQLQGIKFEWDESKARVNVQKHGVTFAEAAEVFFDPFYLMMLLIITRSENLYWATRCLNEFC